MRPRLLAVILGAWFVILPPAHAQLQSFFDSIKSLAQGESTPSDPPPAEQEQWAREQLAAIRMAWDKNAEETTAAQLVNAGLPASDIEEFRQAVRESADNFQSGIDTLSSISQAEAKAQKSSAAWPVPRSPEDAESVRDKLKLIGLDLRAVRSRIEILRLFLDEKSTQSESAGRDIRRAAEESKSARTDESRARAALHLKLAELQKLSADAGIFYGRWKIFEQSLIEQSLLAEQKAAQSALDAGGFPRLLDSTHAAGQLAAIKRELASLHKDSDSIAKESAVLEQEKKSAEPGTFSPESAQLLNALQSLPPFIQGLERLLEFEQNHWSAIVAQAQAPDNEALRNIVSEAESAQRLIADWKPLIERRLSDSRQGLEAARLRLANAQSDKARATLKRTVSAQERLLELMGNARSRSEQTSEMLADFLNEVRSDALKISPSERARLAWSSILKSAADFWNLEITHVGNNSLTVGKISMALLSVVLALWLAKFLSLTISQAVARQFHMDKSRRLIIEKASFFLVSALLVFTALLWLNIPLTAFAFLGGALAIGVGFGVQNLMNNFISGLILILERQIKPGDIIEVGPAVGRVIHLGSRCSKIRKFDGTEVLIPNSSFLEKDVTHWTLDDPEHRYDFTVGVAYGSEVTVVISLVQSILSDHPHVLKSPAPSVFLEAFGDSAIVFRIYYWCDLATDADARQVGSDIRVSIVERFFAAGISMPFPQRDIHISSLQGIAIRPESEEPHKTAG